MKVARVVLLAALALPALGKDAPVPAGLIELGGEHVVLIAGSQSHDGRYAVGWTVQPKKGRAAVEWSRFGKEDGTFREEYCDNADYLVTNVVVDLERRAIAASMPFTDAYFGGKNHGSLQSVFAPERDGRRFAIAMSDGKWNPYGVVLVDLGPDGAVTMELLNTLEAGVHKYIASQVEGGKRLDPDAYATDYQLFELPEIGLLSGFADPDTVRIPFTSEIPKALEARAFHGTLKLRLSRGKGGPRAEVIEVKESKGDPEPTQDHPAVAAADKELNAAYGAARAAANAAGKARLLEEQRAWIKERDDQVAGLRAKILEEGGIANPRFATDQLFLKLTQERTAALRGK